ncbi:MAG: hypothetical protein ACLPJH_17300 [Myxococcaceae bacterium]
MSSKDPLDLDEPLGDEPPQAPFLGLVPELMRKAAFAGLGALFMTEEGLRRTAAQLPLPKEALAALVAQAERTKDEVTRVLAEELRRFLRSDGLKRELSQIFAGMSVEVKARIRLVPDEKPGPPSRPTVRVTPAPAARARKRKTSE